MADVRVSFRKQQRLQRREPFWIPFAHELLISIDLEQLVVIRANHREQAHLKEIDIIVREAALLGARRVRVAAAHAELRPAVHVHRFRRARELDRLAALVRKQPLHCADLPLEVPACVVQHAAGEQVEDVDIRVVARASTVPVDVVIEPEQSRRARRAEATPRLARPFVPIHGAVDARRGLSEELLAIDRDPRGVALAAPASRLELVDRVPRLHPPHSAEQV
eukprot:CAMPEP_0113262866 /NCGR_PEP_ID=MMETSP0008_2-20120614/18148_1 /TAXON_ID=97485 /ORGANISM="Prymnesium parvum" /LENGTH=221 /DNA_ID=CAMNT_0000111549 /DNA_START=251 /DNA_END=913 /DNA_ORIENTATION=- /assembly_acc=CAM_ASM_000153